MTPRDDPRLRAHRNHLLGLWAARRLGLDGGSALAYADEVSTVATRAPDDETIVAKILADFALEELDLAPEEVRRELQRLSSVAAEQIEHPG